MKFIRPNLVSQKESITLKDKTELKLLAGIKYGDIKAIDRFQEAKGSTDTEKLVGVCRGSARNPPSLKVLSDNDVSFYGRRFLLSRVDMGDQAFQTVGAVKDGVLKIYEVYDEKGNNSKANYGTNLKIVGELGAELPDYNTAIPAIALALGSAELSKGGKNALKGIRFYVQGNASNLANLTYKVYTWDEEAFPLQALERTQ